MCERDGNTAHDISVRVSFCFTRCFPAQSWASWTLKSKDRQSVLTNLTESCPSHDQEFCKNLDEDDFNRLWGDFVSHQSPAELEQARSLVEAGRRPAGMKDATDPFAVPPALPAAVLSSRGIGSEADDCDMFPRLISFLREKKVSLRAGRRRGSWTMPFPQLLPQ